MSRLLHILHTGAEEAGISITGDQAALMQAHADQLTLWNKKINLTAITAPDQVAVKHFLDCLFILDHLPGAGQVLDIGSGGGFPGIVIKIMRPELSVVLVDAVRKKVNFLNQVIRVLGLSQIQAVHARAETLAERKGFACAFDAVVCRAFSDLETFTRLAAPFLSDNGLLLAMKGGQGGDEQTAVLQADYTIDTHVHRLPVSRNRRSIVCLKRRNV